jgi:hypothetical protein
MRGLLLICILLGAVPGQSQDPRYFPSGVALTCLIAIGCKGQDLEKRFFHEPAGNRVERLRRYSLDEQYRIFRYGMDRLEPPAMGLRGPIAERGAAAVPFLANKLNVDTDDIAVRDIELIFAMMEVTGSYNVKADASLMTVLTSKIAGMKSKAWQDMCLKVLKEIRESKYQSQSGLLLCQILQPDLRSIHSEDPIGFDDGPNVYSHVHNSPLNLREPFGLSASSVAWCFVKGAARGAAGLRSSVAP